MSAYKITAFKNFVQNGQKVEHSASLEYVIADGYQPKTADEREAELIDLEGKVRTLLISLGDTK